MGARAEGGIRVRGAEICVAPGDHAVLGRLKYGESRGEGKGMRSVVMGISYLRVYVVTAARHPASFRRVGYSGRFP